MITEVCIIAVSPIITMVRIITVVPATSDFQDIVNEGEACGRLCIEGDVLATGDDADLVGAAHVEEEFGDGAGVFVQE